MALMTWNYTGNVSRDAESTTDYGLFTGLSYSGLPDNIKIKRCYWQWTISREKGSTYGRWYEYGNSSNKGSAGTNGTYTFDVALVTATSGQLRVYLGSQYGKTTYSNISFNIEFDYLQSSFTLSTTNVEAGKAITANIAIQDATATHRLTWQFGTRTSVVTTAAGVASSSFTPPLAWLDQIPNATSGLASCTLETINSSGTVVGSQVLYFNILAPSSVVPSISAFTATRVDNSVPSAWGVYVQGQSGVTAKATAAGAYGSTITGYTLTGDGKTASAATLSIAKISGSGTLTFKATVVDSRGRSASKTLTIDVVAWSSPTIKTLSVGRCNADGSANPAGSSILVNLTGAIASVSSKNNASVTVKYRAQGSTTWLSGATGAVASGSWVIAADAALPTNAYEVQAVLTDAFTSATQTTVLPTAECFLDQMPGRKRLGIGGYNDTDKSVYINPEWGIHWGEKRITDSSRNLLDNSDFSNPVNQRGETSYTGTVYGIDRWFGHVAYQAVTPRSIDVTVTSTGTSYAGIMQKVPNIARYAGKTLTFACNLYTTVKADLRIVDASANNIAYVTAEAGQRTIVLTFIVPTDATPDNCVPTILLRTTASGDYMRLYWAALYEGSYTAETLPEYVPKGYGSELAECMRYYQRRDYVITVSQPINDTIVSGFDFMMPMRTNPTITIYDNAGTSGAISMWTSAGITNGIAVTQIARNTKSGVGYMVIATAPTVLARLIYRWEASADL